MALMGACTPQVETPEPQPPAVDTATSAPTTPAAVVEAPVVEEGLGRGVVIATNAEAPSVAPARHVSEHGARINHLTNNGLFRTYYYDLSPIPDLVVEWAAISDTLFEFTLHQGVMFHNGEELTAYDVVASLAYVRNYPEARAAHGSVYSAEVVDRFTLRIDTGEPNALLFFDLAAQGNLVMPESLINAGHDFQADPVGSGPFVFDEWRLGDSISVVAFDNHFNPERSANVESITFRIIPEGSSRTIALEIGEVDFIVEVPFTDLHRLEDHQDITVFMRQGVGYNFMLMNNDLPMFNNVYVRRAIDMAIDKEAAVLASLDGVATPAWANVPLVFPGSSSEGVRSFDPNGARALLAEHNIDPSTINFEMLVFNEEGRRRAEVAQSNLADIGMTTTISLIDLATYLSLTQFGDFEAGFSGFSAHSLLAFLRATSHIDSIDAQNRSRMYNRELSDLIDQAIATVDPDARLAVLEQASRVANEHVGFIPMHQNMLVRAFNSNLAVPEISAGGSDLYFNMIYWTD